MGLPYRKATTVSDTTPKIDFGEEFWQAYYLAVEGALDARKQNGNLLSTFDLIAGASVIFFLTGNNDKMPAKWVFAAVSDGMLPDGLLDEVQRQSIRLREATSIIDSLDEADEELAKMLEEVRALRVNYKKQVKLASDKLGEVSALKAKTRVMP